MSMRIALKKSVEDEDMRIFNVDYSDDEVSVEFKPRVEAAEEGRKNDINDAVVESLDRVVEIIEINSTAEEAGQEFEQEFERKANSEGGPESERKADEQEPALKIDLKIDHNDAQLHTEKETDRNSDLIDGDITGQEEKRDSEHEIESNRPVQYFEHSWIGDAIKTKRDITYYKAVEIVLYSEDDDNDYEEMIEVGSCVELKTLDEEPYLVRIFELYEFEGEAYMTAYYFYRQSDISKREKKRMNNSLSEKDIFTSKHTVSNYLSCINKVCKVYYEIPKGINSPVIEAADYAFLCRYFYNTTKKRLVALTLNDIKEYGTKKTASDKPKEASSPDFDTCDIVLLEGDELGEGTEPKFQRLKSTSKVRSSEDTAHKFQRLKPSSQLRSSNSTGGENSSKTTKNLSSATKAKTSSIASRSLTSRERAISAAKMLAPVKRDVNVRVNTTSTISMTSTHGKDKSAGGSIGRMKKLTVDGGSVRVTPMGSNRLHDVKQSKLNGSLSTSKAVPSTSSVKLPTENPTSLLLQSMLASATSKPSQAKSILPSRSATGMNGLIRKRDVTNYSQTGQNARTVPVTSSSLIRKRPASSSSTLQTVPSKLQRSSSGVHASYVEPRYSPELLHDTSRYDSYSKPLQDTASSNSWGVCNTFASKFDKNDHFQNQLAKERRVIDAVYTERRIETVLPAGNRGTRQEEARVQPKNNVLRVDTSDWGSGGASRGGEGGWGWGNGGGNTDIRREHCRDERSNPHRSHSREDSRFQPKDSVSRVDTNDWGSSACSTDGGGEWGWSNDGGRADNSREHGRGEKSNRVRSHSRDRVGSISRREEARLQPRGSASRVDTNDWGSSVASECGWGWGDDGAHKGNRREHNKDPKSSRRMSYISDRVESRGTSQGEARVQPKDRVSKMDTNDWGSAGTSTYGGGGWGWGNDGDHQHHIDNCREHRIDEKSSRVRSHSRDHVGSRSTSRDEGRVQPRGSVTRVDTNDWDSVGASSGGGDGWGWGNDGVHQGNRREHGKDEKSSRRRSYSREKERVQPKDNAPRVDTNDWGSGVASSGSEWGWGDDGGQTANRDHGKGDSSSHYRSHNREHVGSRGIYGEWSGQPKDRASKLDTSDWGSSDANSEGGWGWGNDGDHTDNRRELGRVEKSSHSRSHRRDRVGSRGNGQEEARVQPKSSVSSVDTNDWGHCGASSGSGWGWGNDGEHTDNRREGGGDEKSSHSRSRNRSRDISRDEGRVQLKDSVSSVDTNDWGSGGANSGGGWGWGNDGKHTDNRREHGRDEKSSHSRSHGRDRVGSKGNGLEEARVQPKSSVSSVDTNDWDSGGAGSGGAWGWGNNDANSHQESHIQGHHRVYVATSDRESNESRAIDTNDWSSNGGSRGSRWGWSDDSNAVPQQELVQHQADRHWCESANEGVKNNQYVATKKRCYDRFSGVENSDGIVVDTKNQDDCTVKSRECNRSNETASNFADDNDESANYEISQDRKKKRGNKSKAKSKAQKCGDTDSATSMLMWGWGNIMDDTKDVSLSQSGEGIVAGSVGGHGVPQNASHGKMLHDNYDYIEHDSDDKSVPGKGRGRGLNAVLPAWMASNNESV